MLKRLLVCALTLFSSFSAFATTNNYVYLGPGVSVVDNVVSQSNFRGLQPRLLMGYAAFLEEMFLAGEVFWVPATVTLDDNYTPSLSQSIKTNMGVGASILPGGSIMDCVLAFARFGIVYSKFPGPNSWRTGGQVGAGIQLDLSRYWDVRVEYTYSVYRSMAMGTPRTDQAGISLVYKVLS